MKIIEGMKKIKDLQRKAADLQGKIGLYCANLDNETNTYGDNQKEQVDTWLQSHGDIVKEILGLRIAIQKTNLETDVQVELGGKMVTKSLAEWVHRRRDLADLDLAAWRRLGDRNLREGTIKNSAGDDVQLKIQRFYDPKKRDEMTELYASEPMAIDAALEVANAVTDLIQ